MIAPMATRWMLPATLLAASMDPLLAWFAHCVADAVVPPDLPALPAEFRRHSCRSFPAKSSSCQPEVAALEMGSYQLIELLGQGGMGEVWRQASLLARNAAIKLVRPEVQPGNIDDGRVLLRRFEREAHRRAQFAARFASTTLA